MPTKEIITDAFGRNGNQIGPVLPRETYQVRCIASARQSHFSGTLQYACTARLVKIGHPPTSAGV